MSNIELVIKQAIVTFNKSNIHNFQENFNKLISITSALSLNDICLSKDLIVKHDRRRFVDNMNPVLFMSIFKDFNVHVTAFVLKSKSVITLHDHPLMHGVLKVLSGKVCIQSYTTAEENIQTQNHTQTAKPKYNMENIHYPYTVCPLPVEKHEPVIIGENDECGIVTPTKNNFHKITSVDGPTAFLDIFSPPYSTSLFDNYGPMRECNYFKEENDGYYTVLVPCYDETDYWCVELPYRGPPINI